VDEVPAFRDPVQRDDERVGIHGRALRVAGGHLVPVLVGHRDDREARLDRLVVGEQDLRGWGVDDAARGRHRANEVRVRRRRRRDRQRDDDPDVEPNTPQPQPAAHASGLPLFETRARPPSRMPTAPTTSATIASVELPPPPSELFASTVGAGASDDSEPFQFTIEPSEYVCSTPNVYVLLDWACARNWKSASS